MTAKTIEKEIAEAKARVRATVTELIDIYPKLPDEKKAELRDRLDTLAREMKEECERIAKGDTRKLERKENGKP